VSDGRGGVGDAAITILIAPVNDAPSVTGDVHNNKTSAKPSVAAPFGTALFSLPPRNSSSSKRDF